MSDLTELIDEDARRQFESDWKSNTLKDFESYLPDPGDSKYWPTLEELLYIDLEFSWKEFEKLPSDETISIHKSPTERLKTISRRLNLDQNQELLERLNDFEQSLREKSKNRRAKNTAASPADSSFEFETVAINEPNTSPARTGDTGVQSNQQFGDYVLLEMLGRGGMGVVFKALEKKTGRKVALKMIRSNIVNRVDEETQRIVIERFQIEAKAVANIDHPNIVTLFDVDQLDDTPYISMQLINGEDFASKIRQSIFDGKTAARYMKTVAAAISAVHDKGMIHRDIKPHNILLNEDTDEPLVTDFGLAKLTDDGSGVTETGELLGTPGYMSPEQARGEPVGPSSDIYSLGATLYCLIGGRAPFQAADTMKTIEQIVKNPPIAPKEVNPDVDADLNTICLKCLEKDPARRYATAQDLAEDLDRYINGEPIKARPLGAVEKSIRWCKRNPLPTTVVVALSLLVLVSGMGTWSYWYFSTQMEFFATKNKDNSDLAFNSHKEELELITGDPGLKLPGMGETRQSLLAPLRQFFEKFIELNGDYDNVRDEFAYAHFALGSILLELGELKEAEVFFSNAIDLQQKILEDDAEKSHVQMDLSNSLNLRGECLVKMEKRDSALKDFNAALEIRNKLVERFPKNDEFKRKLANITMNLGNWYGFKGDLDSEATAYEHYETSAEIRNELDGSKTKAAFRFQVEYDKAKCLYNMAVSQRNLDKIDRCKKLANSSLDLFRKLKKEKPRLLNLRRDKAICAEFVGGLASTDEAIDCLTEAAADYEFVSVNYPTEAEYNWHAARLWNSLADVWLREKMDFAKATQYFEKGFAKIEKKKINSSDARAVWVHSCVGLSTVYMISKQNDKAAEKISAARQALNKLDKEHEAWKPFDNQIKQLEKQLGVGVS